MITFDASLFEWDGNVGRCSTDLLYAISKDFRDSRTWNVSLALYNPQTEKTKFFQFKSYDSSVAYGVIYVSIPVSNEENQVEIKLQIAVNP